jgi:hypothetical protein
MTMRHAGCKIQNEKWRRSGIVCILHFACCMALAASASATVLLPADFTAVVAGSVTIVHGRVSEVRAGLTGPRRTIESFVTVQVIQALKGSSPADGTVTFRVPNGQVGRYRRVVVGAPEFAAGDEVVIFLRGQAPAIPSLYGLSQGVYRVIHDASAGSLVMPAPVVAQGPGAERVVRGDPVRRPLPIDTFVRQVRTIAEGRR